MKGERGYMLLTLLFILTLMIIAMAAAVPYAKIAIKRDKEQELIHRGTQYARAIGRYYKRFGRYPASIDQLENTNNIRFLRKRYKDPMTGKDDWTIRGIRADIRIAIRGTAADWWFEWSGNQQSHRSWHPGCEFEHNARRGYKLILG